MYMKTNYSMPSYLPTAYLMLAVILSVTPLHAGKNHSTSPKKSSSDDIAFMNAIIMKKNSAEKTMLTLAQKKLDEIIQSKDQTFAFFTEETETSLKNALVALEKYMHWLETTDSFFKSTQTITTSIIDLSIRYHHLLKKYDEHCLTETMLLETIGNQLQLKFDNEEDVTEDYIRIICLHILSTSSDLDSDTQRFLRMYGSLNSDELKKYIKKDQKNITSVLTNHIDNSIKMLAQLISLCGSYWKITLDLDTTLTKLLDIMDAYTDLLTSKKIFPLHPTFHNTIIDLYNMLNDCHELECHAQIENGYDQRINAYTEEIVYLLSKIHEVHTLAPQLKKEFSFLTLNMIKLDPSSCKKKSQRPHLKKKIATCELFDETDDNVESDKQEHDLCTVEPQRLPYTKISNHIALWLSGINYLDEALHIFKARYDYTETYMAKNKDAIINAHTLPLETDSYIQPLAKKEPWFDHNNQQTGWFYTIPGHLTDHKNHTNLRGLFTWGIAFDGKCLHRSFTTRENKHLFNTLHDSEYTKTLYERSLSDEQKEHTKQLLETSKTPVTVLQDPWDVKIHDKDKNLTLALSKCIYKLRKKELMKK